MFMWPILSIVKRRRSARGNVFGGTARP